nr:hypothetical protein [Fertoeibacter niger]
MNDEAPDFRFGCDIPKQGNSLPTTSKYPVAVWTEGDGSKKVRMPDEPRNLLRC